MTDAPRALIPMFEQRRIEAMILKHVYDTLKQSHGIEVAQQLALEWFDRYLTP